MERIKAKTSAFIAPYVVSCYDESRFCDLLLVCEGNRTVPCHRIVLCSLSERLRRYQLKLNIVSFNSST